MAGPVVTWPTWSVARCECGHWDNLHLATEGCQGMGETWDTDCRCEGFRPELIDGSKRPPSLSPEVRKKRADSRDRGVLNDGGEGA